MAIIKFVNNKVGLKKTLNYICKEEKTEGKYIFGKDCTYENAFEEMMAVKNMFGKTSGREKLHFIQSFNPTDDLDYELAQKIARQIVDKFFKGYQVVVATHQDKEHIHSHFVVNTVNFENGKKIQLSIKDLEKIKEYSNKLCLENGLSITRQKSNVDDIRINEYVMRKNNSSWKYELEKAIDSVLEKSNNKRDFFRNMNSLGYKVTWTNEKKNITYTTPEGFKCRDRKLHKEKYLKENMEEYFRKKQLSKINGYKVYEEKIRFRSITSTLSQILEQFKNRNNENEQYSKMYGLSDNAKKQYLIDMHYSTEELDDMEM